jgi:hypothetical protein
VILRRVCIWNTAAGRENEEFELGRKKHRIFDGYIEAFEYSS